MATRFAPHDSPVGQIEAELIPPLIRMASHVSRVPPEIGNSYYGLTRSERHVAHPMGPFPRWASAFASAGAPWVDVNTPLTTVQSWLWLNFYQPILPCFMECHSLETEANNILNHSQNKAIKDPHDSALDALIDGCNQQIAATRMLRSVAASMKHSHKRTA